MSRNDERDDKRRRKRRELSSESVLSEGFNPEESAVLFRFFRDEAHEHLENITRHLLHASAVAALESVAITNILRATHTLKGSAATLGLAYIAEAAHQLEDSVAQLGLNPSAWSSAIADVTVEAVDILRAIVDSSSDAVTMSLLKRFDDTLTIFRSPSDQTNTTELDLQVPHSQQAERDNSKLASHLNSACSSDGPHNSDANALGADRNSDTFESEHIRASSLGITSRAVSNERRTWVDRRRDTHHVLRIDATHIDRLLSHVDQLTRKRTHIERSTLALHQLARELTNTCKDFRRQALTDGNDNANPAGRLTEIEASLAQSMSLLMRETSALVDEINTLKHTTHALKQGLIQVRMTSLRPLFEHLARSVRTFCRTAKKRVHVHTSGDETVFDKAIADQITDPLTQILCNAIAHGIESGDERKTVGKPAAGQIRLDARREGDTLCIEVSDDGKGIETSILRQRLVDDAHWSKQQAATSTDAEIHRAIFEPGVSSRLTTDMLAGRGIGLHTVKKTIARLGGDIQLASRPGHGTTFTLRLPFTPSFGSICDSDKVR